MGSAASTSTPALPVSCAASLPAMNKPTYMAWFFPTFGVQTDKTFAELPASPRFKIVDEAQSVMAARDYISGGHIVIDTEANLARVDFAEVARGCDLLVIPAVPETTATDGLTYTLKALRDIGTSRYRVLLTKVRPKPNSDADELRRNLAGADIPVFSASIPNLIAFDKASAHGVAVNDAPDPYAARAWEAYQSAGKEIINGQQ